MDVSSFEDCLAALLRAPRPGAEKVLAFHDHRLGVICADARLLLMPLDDHLCLRGDGLFESLCCRDGVVLALDAHLDRLRAGCRALRLEPPCPWEDVRRRILDVARAGGRPHCAIRLLLGRGPGGFGVSPDECPEASLHIVALRQDPLTEEECRARGLSAFASRIPPKQDYLARIKSVNYLPNVLMAQEAGDRGMDVAVTFDELGRMCEAATAGVGIVDARGVLACPPEERILASTSMLEALKAAVRCGMRWERRDIFREDIAAAREMLLFTSSSLCLSVTGFEGAPVGAGVPGPAAGMLRASMLQSMLDSGTKF